MAINTLPSSLLASSFEMVQIFNDEEFRTSEGAVFVSGRNGNRHELILTFRNVKGFVRRFLWAAVYQTAGKRNQIRVFPYVTFGYQPSGVFWGTSPQNAPQLVGAHTAGAVSLAVDSMTLTTDNYLRRGDLCMIGNELKVITTEVDSDGSGVGTIKIWPELHQDYPNNEVIVIDPPLVAGIFYLSDAQGLSATPWGNIGEATNSKWISPQVTLRLEEDVTA